MDDDHHKLFSSINYEEANDNNYGFDYYIDAGFDDYDSSVFTIGEGNDDDGENPYIWIKKIDLDSDYWDDNEIITYSFTRKTFLVSIAHGVNEELYNYEEEVSYTLYDCRKDFDRPDIFLIP